MGINVSVFRNAGGDDTTLNGVSSRHSRLCVVNVPGPFEPSDDCPAVLLLPGYVEGTLIIVEAWDINQPGQATKWVPRPGRPMKGGNYAATSDSRFNRMCENMLGHPFYAGVPIHDRYES